MRTGTERTAAHPTVVVAPVMLTSLRAIKQYFQRGEKTIKTWYADGAPIAFDGRQYSAELNSLHLWLVTNSKR